MSTVSFTSTASIASEPLRSSRPKEAAGSSFHEVLSRASVNAPSHQTSHLPQTGDVLNQIEVGRQKLEQMIAQARAGRSFSPRELLCMQAELYQIIEQSSLAQRVAEEGVSSVKRLWNIQV
jgi:hypothetical protein